MSSDTTPTGLRFLIIDGYPEKERNKLQEAGMELAWGLYAVMLLGHMPDAAYDVLLPGDGVPMPDAAALAGYDGILWTGCNQTIYDLDNPSVVAQIGLAKDAYRVGIPSFGTCWGIQMAVVAAGGEVRLHPKGREIGQDTKIRLTEAGVGHPMYEGKPPVFSGIVSHVDQVTEMPPGATLLAIGRFCHVQAAAVTHEKGTFWGLQYHPEYSVHDLARIMTARTGLLLAEGFFTDPEEARQHTERLEQLHRHPDRKDLRWQLGIDDDLLEVGIRQCEFANWLKHLVVPTARARR